MSYEFTKLPEVEILESLTENAHLIVEDGGNTRRFPANAIGGGDKVLGENGKLLNSVLPDGYPYKEVTKEKVIEFSAETVEGEDFSTEGTANVAYNVIDRDVMSNVIDSYIDMSLTINYDGTDYECEQKTANFGGMVNGYGNLALYFGDMAEDTGEPFAWFRFNNQAILATATVGVHLVVAYSNNKVVTPMDEELLPVPEDLTDGNGGILMVRYELDENNNIVPKYEVMSVSDVMQTS